MCCLLGLVDVKHKLSGYEKRRIVYSLAVAGEARGTDATGYAYNSGGKLIIEKQPIPAHRMRIRIPHDAYVITGHTRMTTQGNARRGRNNHPFLGQVPDMQFALAHNGVLSNDQTLRVTHKLPHTRIETDSYVAVQLIEEQKALDMKSIRCVAELLKGTFNLTILDRNNRLYLVRGNNPLCIYHYKKEGFFVYASTKVILEEALKELGLLNVPHEEVYIGEGEILAIDPDGRITRSYFKPPVSYYNYPLYDCWSPLEKEPTGYRKCLLDFAGSMGIPKEELDYLHNMGFSDCDLELCIYDREYRVMCLYDSGYYDEMEGSFYEDAYFESLPWT